MDRCRDKIILIIDDCHHIREHISFYLGMMGYKWLEAASGEEALKLVDQASAQLVDLKMEGMSGGEYLRELEKINHKILFRTAIVTGFIKRGEVRYPYLQKPFCYKQMKELLLVLMPDEKDYILGLDIDDDW